MTINTTPARPRASDRRQRLADAVLDEMLSWNPREFITAFRRWHHGSFSLIHLNVLTVLDAEGPDSMSHLAEALDVSVASMTGIVDRMEKRDLVERRHEEGDRRVVVVYPTDTGRDVFREIDVHRRVGLGKLLERLSTDELDGLLRGHRALRQARSEAVAARAAALPEHVDAGSAAATAPSRLHARSTIAPDDPAVRPTTGSGR